jgi:hypothetical protein
MDYYSCSLVYTVLYYFNVLFLCSSQEVRLQNAREKRVVPRKKEWLLSRALGEIDGAVSSRVTFRDLGGTLICFMNQAISNAVALRISHLRGEWPYAVHGRMIQRQKNRRLSRRVCGTRPFSVTLFLCVRECYEAFNGDAASVECGGCDVIEYLLHH